MMNKIQVLDVQEENNIISVHSSTSDGSISILKECYILLYDIYHEYGVSDHGNASNKHMIRKWYQKCYTIQEKEHVEHHDVKRTCSFNNFT